MKSVLITGASGGFGMNTALALAEAGWRVFASMRSETSGAALLAAATDLGCAAHIRIVAFDVTDAASVERAATEILEDAGGTLDALVNNAGYGMIGAFEDLSDADCRAQMETNFFGALAVTRAFLPAMREAGRGRIVIVTSNAVNAPHPLLSMYAASKWALEGWAEGLAMEVAPFGIEVVVVQPGAHRTPFAQHVVPVLREGSAYAGFCEQTWPGMNRLDGWGREPAAATPAMVDAVVADNPPFRTALGEDTVVFAMLKGSLPYEARAWLLRAIVGLPGRAASGNGDDAGTIGGNVLARVAEEVANKPELGRALVGAITRSDRRQG